MRKEKETKKQKKVGCFRDLGGIVCAGGRQVVQGKLFRSGHLGKLSAAAAEKMYTRHGIAHIVDLRSDSEVRDVPDVVARAAEYHRFTPLDDTRNPSVTRKTRLKILKRLMAKEGGTRKHLCDTYRSLVSLPAALEAYSGLLHLLAEKGESVLWHCTQGKDRTGFGSAVVLLALGADRETVIRDYLDYNLMRRGKNMAIFVAVLMLKFSLHMSRSLNNLLTAQEDYLRAAFDEMDRLYGSTEGFLKNALMLTDEHITQLRSQYLA